MNRLAADLVIRDAPLASPITSARGTWTWRRGVLLALRDPEGRVGRGEATPLPSYSPDDADDCARAITAVCARLDPHAETIPRDLDASLAHLPAARFAVETALSELAAVRRGWSVASYLAAAPVIHPIARAGLVDLASPDLEDEARALMARGVVTIKAKIGVRPLHQDMEALVVLRRAIGAGVALRLDANGALGAGARAALERLARVEPELVEEPVSGEALARLGPCAVPWAADESLQDAHIAERLLAGPCAAFVLKPALLGLHASRALALRAQAHGKGVVVTHLFDGPIALAAACELALSLPSPPRACGLDLHPGLALFDRMRIPQLDAPGKVAPHAGVGLGVA
jgi:o-succinylbenzoate synthase